MSIIVLWLTGTAWAWPPKDHRVLVSWAIERCPPELSSFLTEHLDAVRQGSVDPDRKFMDTLNHTYEVHDGTRNNPDHVAYLSTALVSMLRNGAPRAKVAYWFGALSHYVADISEPLHTSDREKNEWWYHLLFESFDYGFEVDVKAPGFEIKTRLGRCLSGHAFAYDGRYDPIEDVKAWQIENAKQAHVYYDEIHGLFTEKDAFDLERLAAIYTTCIDMAGNDIIDLWVHVYRAAGTSLESLPNEDAVLLLEVDRKERFRLGGERIAEQDLRTRLARSVDEARRHADRVLTPVYAEVDDRCGPDAVTRLEKLCEEAGIERVSTILVTKGSWPSRFARAAAIHLRSLRD